MTANREQNENNAHKTAAPAPKGPEIILRISYDNMRMEVRLQETGEVTLPPRKEDILRAVKEKGVVKGVNMTAVERLCQAPVYGQGFIIAQGKRPSPGTDGYILYLIETKRELKPKLEQDGTVNYRDMGFVQNVTKDQPLCEIHPACPGEDGWDIKGKPLPGLPGREPIVPMGRNTHVSEDGTRLLASCDGNLQIQGGKIYIVDVLRLQGHVDNSTGDIDFVGDVVVAGDIFPGFMVKSGGSITVKGSVEGGMLEAKGDITITEGAVGLERGYLKAGGNIRCRYIQGCRVQAGGSVYADVVMYSQTECGANLELIGGKGTLIGGGTSVGGCIIAKTIGTASHVATKVAVYTNLALQKEYNELEAKREGQKRELDKLLMLEDRLDVLKTQNRLRPEQEESRQAVRNSRLQMQEAIRQTATRQMRIRREMEREGVDGRRIECKGRIHVGVTIGFGNQQMVVQSSFVNSRVYIKDREISIAPL